MSTHSVHQFAEKVAVITDVADAIGRAAAIQLALNGAFVIGGEPESDDPSGIVEELRSLGTLAGAIQCDTGTASGAAALAGEADRMFGRMDLLVNCLKTTPKSTFPETSEEDLNAEVGGVARAAVLVTQAALPLMSDRPKPKIVNVFGSCDPTQSAADPLFAASQASVAAFTRALARALPAKFRVNGVEIAGWSAYETAGDNELLSPRRGVQPDDAARAVLYLLSSESIAVNGEIVRLTS